MTVAPDGPDASATIDVTVSMVGAYLTPVSPLWSRKGNLVFISILTSEISSFAVFFHSYPEVKTLSRLHRLGRVFNYTNIKVFFQGRSRLNKK